MYCNCWYVYDWLFSEIGAPLSILRGPTHFSYFTESCNGKGQKVDCVDSFLLYLISLDPKMTRYTSMIYSFVLAQP